MVLGGDGYIGHALSLRLKNKGYNVISFDNFSRRKSVEEMNSFSAIQIDSTNKRTKILEQYGEGEYLFVHDNVTTNYKNLAKYVGEYKPKAIINLAQQPSAPFSHKSREHAIYTTINNTIGTLNILFAIHEGSADTHLVHIGTMGEYDHSAGLPIYEGTFDLTLDGKTANVVYPRRPGSWYHSAKVSSTYHIDCACRWWGLRATDIMQGVVYGNWTPEIEETKSHTRLDSDEAFGTIVNRFIVQAALGIPLTVYGDGKHSRGFLALNDSIQCLMLAIENPPEKEEYRTWNQLDETWSMNEIATQVKVACNIPVSIQHIPTPRKEKTDYFPYNVMTSKLNRLGFKQTRTIEDEVKYVMDILLKRDKELEGLREVVIPKIKWDK